MRLYELLEKAGVPSFASRSLPSRRAEAAHQASRHEPMRAHCPGEMMICHNFWLYFKIRVRAPTL
jgi:hypothetical protein